MNHSEAEVAIEILGAKVATPEAKAEYKLNKVELETK
jgi:hypothetical protein